MSKTPHEPLVSPPSPLRSGDRRLTAKPPADGMSDRAPAARGGLGPDVEEAGMERAVISRAVLEIVSEDAIERIRRTLAAGTVVCTVCETPVAEREARTSVLALRGADGTVQIRFAHEHCAEPRLIELGRLPVRSPAPPHARAPQPPVAWALTARRRRLPTVVLACDVACLANLDLRDHTLMQALRLDELCGGRSLQELRAPRYDAITLVRDRSTLWLSTPYGSEALEVDTSEPALALLRLAAHQHELLLVLGPALQLGSGTFDHVEALLRHDAAVAARVRLEDPDLSSWPPRGGRRRLAHRTGFKARRARNAPGIRRRVGALA